MPLLVNIDKRISPHLVIANRPSPGDSTLRIHRCNSLGKRRARGISLFPRLDLRKKLCGGIGIATQPLGLALVIVSAVAAVAAFDAVGSIIVIAMFICPPAAARLMTNSLEGQVAWSVLFAVLSAVVGYVAAGYGPLWLGYASTVSAAGMIATVSGLILALTSVFGPHR